MSTDGFYLPHNGNKKQGGVAILISVNAHLKYKKIKLLNISIRHILHQECYNDYEYMDIKFWHNKSLKANSIDIRGQIHLDSEYFNTQFS